MTNGEGLIERLVAWTSDADRCCILNSNRPVFPTTPYAAYDVLAGKGCIDEVSATADALPALDRFAERHRNRWIFGFVSYDVKNEIERLSSRNPDRVGMPALHLFVPETVIVGRGGGVSFFSGEHNRPISVPAGWRAARCPDGPPDRPFTLARAMPRDEYHEKVRAVKAHIQRGDVYELNLCQEFFSEKVSIDPGRAYLRLNALSPAPMSAFYRLGDRYVLSSSPERFLKKEGRRLVSQPMKGTARRGDDDKEDDRLRNALLAHEKERAENVMIVDLVRNDLSRIAARGSVGVEELFGVYTFPQVHQMISTVGCTLRENVSPATVFRAAFPMGSMTGAPKIRAMELIDRYENARRGLFSGCIGYIAPDGDFDWNVLIRTAFYVRDEVVSFMTGGAITAGSSAEAEYDECLLKAGALARALGTAL